MAKPLNSAVVPMLTGDPDKADKSGFLHNQRIRWNKVRCILFGYPDKDGNPRTNDDGSPVQAPGIQIKYTIKGSDAEGEQFYSNGSALERVPVNGGKGFGAVKGAKIKAGLAEGSNAWLLVASLKSCGLPTDVLAKGDYSVLEGLEADMIAQPIGQNKRAKAEGERARTIPVVGKIVTFPNGIEGGDGAEDADEVDDEDAEETPLPKSKKKAAPVEDDDDDDADTDDDDEEEAPAADTDDDDDEEDEAPPKKVAKKPAPPADDDDEDDDAADPLAASAQEYVAEVLQLKKYRGKVLDLPTLSKEVLQLARANKNRQKIVAIVQDPAFHKANTDLWLFDKKAKTVELMTE